jgi:RNA polymerase sigma-70 factor (ECF subfamily)
VNPEQRNLVNRCNSGDKSAWEELYSKYAPMVRAVIRKVSSTAIPDLEDICQEVFIQLFRALQNYDAARSLETYILEIARRVTISQLRSKNALKRGGLEHGYELVSDEKIKSEGDNQEDAFLKAEETGRLRTAFNYLSINCRKLLSLRYVSGFSYKEISSQLAEKEVTLRVKVRRCLLSLEEKFAELSIRKELVEDGFTRIGLSRRLG